ncbi:Virulence-associated protein I [Corynebacterium pseudotuberculosis]|nr:Virulence-associated protein I [Corynebacterium pseudotuberculosis]
MEEIVMKGQLIVLSKRDTTPRHPGEILDTDYLKPRKLSHYDLVKSLHITETMANRFVAGHIPVNDVIAFGLGHLFHESPELWVRRQEDWDLAQNAENNLD